MCRNGSLVSNATTKCVTISCTLFDEYLPINLYVDNPSYIRAVAYQRRRYVRGGENWRQEVMFSYNAYGKSRLTPSSTSDLQMTIQRPTIINLWIRSWLIGRSKIRILTVINATSNIKIFPCFPSE